MIREIELQWYLPEVLKNIYEMRELTKAESLEINNLFKEAELRFSDNYILNASVQGLKRYESMLKIPSNARASPEERRQKILMLWNRQLPYTMKRLVEQLALWAGDNGFSVDTEKLGKYILAVYLIDKELPLLKNIKSSVEQMIPANLLLNLSGQYPSKVPINIKYENMLKIQSSCYPRFNLAYLQIDGTWRLDKNRVLNGYNSDNLIDFYPIKLHLNVSVKNAVCLDMEGIKLQMRARLGVGVNGFIRIENNVEASCFTEEWISVYINAREQLEIETAVRIQSKAYENIQVDYGIEIHSESSENIKSEEQFHFRSPENHYLLTDSCMTKMNCSDGVWKLNGIRKLDGGRHIL